MRGIPARQGLKKGLFLAIALTAGLSLTAWIRPVLWFAVPVVILIAVLSLMLSPWAISKSEEFKSYMDNRDDVSQVTPGVFRESKQPAGPVLVERHESGERDGDLHVFERAADDEDGREESADAVQL